MSIWYKESTGRVVKIGGVPQKVWTVPYLLAGNTSDRNAGDIVRVRGGAQPFTFALRIDGGVGGGTKAKFRVNVTAQLPSGSTWYAVGLRGGLPEFTSIPALESYRVVMGPRSVQELYSDLLWNSNWWDEFFIVERQVSGEIDFTSRAFGAYAPTDDGRLRLYQGSAGTTPSSSVSVSMLENGSMDSPSYGFGLRIFDVRGTSYDIVYKEDGWKEMSPMDVAVDFVSQVNAFFGSMSGGGVVRSEVNPLNPMEVLLHGEEGGRVQPPTLLPLVDVGAATLIPVELEVLDRGSGVPPVEDFITVTDAFQELAVRGGYRSLNNAVHWVGGSDELAHPATYSVSVRSGLTDVLELKDMQRGDIVRLLDLSLTWPREAGDGRGALNLKFNRGGVEYLYPVEDGESEITLVFESEELGWRMFTSKLGYVELPNTYYVLQSEVDGSNPSSLFRIEEGSVDMKSKPSNNWFGLRVKDIDESNGQLSVSKI